MDNRQALGYMLLVCKSLGMDKEQTRKMYLEMLYQFDMKSEEEAEEHGHSWYHNLSVE